MSDASLSIIIPTCNRPDFLAKCLGALIPQLPAGRTCEILVGDDSRDERTREMVGREFPHVLYGQGPQLGPGGNRNAAAARATGEWLVFIDDDCLPRTGYIAAYAEAIEAAEGAKAVFLVGPTYPMGLAPSLLWESPEYRTGSIPASCNFAVRRRVYLEVGGFDERFRYSFEDIEFFARAMEMKIPFQFVPEAAVDHPWRSIPGPSGLSRRWESRVISSLDAGMAPLEIAWRLPRHIALVILSRFRGARLSLDNARAGVVYLGELLVSIWRLPGWLRRQIKGPRSAYWSARMRENQGNRAFRL